MVKNSPSNAGGAGSMPGWEARILHPSGPKNQIIKRKQYCNKVIKTLKIVHIKIILKKKLIDYSVFTNMYNIMRLYHTHSLDCDI